MDYISQRLTDLRQEIGDLRSQNSRYSRETQHTPNDQSAFETRTNRLLQIKKELSTMRDRPRESAVWWERMRASGSGR